MPSGVIARFRSILPPEIARVSWHHDAEAHDGRLRTDHAEEQAGPNRTGHRDDDSAGRDQFQNATVSNRWRMTRRWMSIEVKNLRVAQEEIGCGDCREATIAILFQATAQQGANGSGRFWWKRRRTGLPRSTTASVSLTSSPLKARLPVSISNSTQPNDQTSLRLSAGDPSPARDSCRLQSRE